MLQIYRLIRARRLTQADAGMILGIKQPNVSRSVSGRWPGKPPCWSASAQPSD